MRAFIAAAIPETLKKGLAELQGRLKVAGVDASWPRPEGVHLTLKFLGEVGQERVPEIMAALSRALGATERFRLGVEGVGTFPNPAYTRVVWLGLTGDVGRLIALQAAVEQTVGDAGLKREARPYTPHLTLGRIKRIRRRDLWLKGLEGVKDCRLPGFEVASISLIRSELGPAGAAYFELGRVALR